MITLIFRFYQIIDNIHIGSIDIKKYPKNYLYHIEKFLDLLFLWIKVLKNYK